MAEITALVNKLISAKLGAGPWVAMEAYSEFYFRGPVFDKIAADPELLAAIKQAIGALPGIARVVRPHGSARPGWQRRPARACGGRRILPRPQWRPDYRPQTQLDSSSLTTRRSSPATARLMARDTPTTRRCRSILLGGGITPGQFDAAASPADLAPTLAKLAGVALPTATGRILDEALKK